MIELLLVLVIAGILIAVALPAGKGMLERAQLRAATNEIYSVLLFTRNEASRLRQTSQLCFVNSASAEVCSSTGTSWLAVFSDATSSNQPVRTFELDEKISVTLTSQGHVIEFQRLGNLGTSEPTYFELSHAGAAKVVEVCFNGRVVIRRNKGESEC